MRIRWRKGFQAELIKPNLLQTKYLFSHFYNNNNYYYYYYFYYTFVTNSGLVLSGVSLKIRKVVTLVFLDLKSVFLIQCCPFVITNKQNIKIFARP